MICLSIGHRVRTLTAARFAELMERKAWCEAKHRSFGFRCQPFYTVDTDPGVAIQEVPEDFRMPPVLGIFPLINGEPIVRGPFSCTVYHDICVERFFRTLTGMADVDIDVTLEACPEGFRLTTHDRSGLIGVGGHAKTFAFAEREAGDQEWLRAPRDEAFLRRSVPAVLQVRREQELDMTRRSKPPLPLLDDDDLLAFEVKPGAWITVPNLMSWGFVGDAVPALILHPERYRWREGIEPQHVLLSRETFLAANLTAFGRREAWEDRMEAIFFERRDAPAAWEAVRAAIDRLCIEREGGTSGGDFACRAFNWTRYVEA